MKEFTSLKDVIVYFSDEKRALSYLEAQLWGDTPICPHCGSTRVYRLADGKKFKCGNKKTCDRKFTVLLGTIYENTKLPLSTWMAAIYLCTAHKKGISSHQLARDLNITQKTAWFLLHRIREMTKIHKVKLKDVVQADEVYIGGVNANRHSHKKKDYAKGEKDKTAVLGTMQQNGVVNMAVLQNTQEETIKPLIRKMVEAGSILITDDLNVYGSLSTEYNHVVVRHNEGEFGRGAFSTNRLEGFWSALRRSLYGIYHCVSPAHLQRYCDENAHRYNLRKMTDPARFALTVRKSYGRLRYADLIKNSNLQAWQRRKNLKRNLPGKSQLNSI